MNSSAFLRGLAAAIAFMPLAGFAGVNKCTDASGVVTYSDQPCQAKEGQRVAEVKDPHAFAAIAAREDDKKVAQACRVLADRRARCRVAVDYMLNTAFISNCEGPMKHDASDQMRERNNMRRDRYNRSYRDDADSSDKSEANLQCEALQANMWKFVKEKFGQAMRAEDIKAIEYRLAAVNPDRRDSYNGKIRHTGD